ncbi:hypothetical protein [Streptomyces sp. NPDC020742]|uniref:hypothetical protein n=1 Tax=Streptomyces sp. NPDC020742 TaxID=3154897 RepID=UPI0033C32661
MTALVAGVLDREAAARATSIRTGKTEAVGGTAAAPETGPETALETALVPAAADG